jgi:serine/threonine protein kinase
MDKYEIEKILGNGSFGNVLKGINKETGELVAIKTEKLCEIKTIQHECKILNYLYRNHCKNIPKIYWYGIYQEWRCMVITYYDFSLENYIKIKGSMKPPALNNFMKKMVGILKNLQKYYVLHRDIKPANIMTQNGDLFLIDFGLATFYVDENGEHLPNEFQKTITGSPNYVSYNNHIGHRLCCRDDFISLGYVYLYLKYGIFEKTQTNKELNNLIHFLKTNIGFTPLCVQKAQIPAHEVGVLNEKMCKKNENEVIQKYFEYLYSVSYGELIDYDLIENLFG